MAGIPLAPRPWGGTSHGYGSFSSSHGACLRIDPLDEYSTQVAETAVTVAGGVLCQVERTYDRVENKTTCAYNCIYPTPTITLEGNVPCPQIFDPE